MGLQVQCGDWQASDDAGDAFTEVIRGVETVLAEAERDAWANEFVPSWEEQDAAIDPEDCETIRIVLSPRLMEVLISPLRRYYDFLAERLGRPDPGRARAREWREGTVGDGAKLECAHALVEAYAACRKSSRPVSVFFS